MVCRKDIILLGWILRSEWADS